MNLQERETLITELPLEANIAYILKDSTIFYSTEYKVLHSQKDGNFINCMKMLFNDQIQLFYHTSTLKRFSSLLPILDTGKLQLLIKNLFSAILSVQSNGFLTCENIDIAFDHIFVDSMTYKVYLIYLPITRRWFDSYSHFESELRTGLIKAISENMVCSKTPEMMHLVSVLEDARLSLEDIFSQINIEQSQEETPGQQKKTDEQTASTPVLHFVAINAAEQLDLAIDKEEFILGRNVDAVDGLISFSEAVSRKHCVIKHNQGNQFTITDLGSANGTFVNGQRIISFQQHPIKPGDIIRLANSDFKIDVR